MKRIILVVVCLGASLTFGAPPPPCYPIAPADGLLVPANAPAFVGPSYYSEEGTLTLRDRTDAGVRELERLDGGPTDFIFRLFVPGPLTGGDLITLESNMAPCGGSGRARADVTVLDAAPLPTEVGTISFGEPVGFMSNAIPAVRRDVLVLFPDEQLPWLSVMRVSPNAAVPNYGHLGRLVTRGTPTVVGSVQVECSGTRSTLTKPVDVSLEIAGRSTVVRGAATAELDCKVAPGCSSVPGTTLALLALWLARRRLGAR